MTSVNITGVMAGQQCSIWYRVCAPAAVFFFVGSLFFKSIIDHSPFALSFITIIVSAVKREMWFSSAAPTDGASAALQSAAGSAAAGQPLPRWSEWAHEERLSLPLPRRDLHTAEWRCSAVALCYLGCRTEAVLHTAMSIATIQHSGCCSDCLFSLFILNLILP